MKPKTGKLTPIERRLSNLIQEMLKEKGFEISDIVETRNGISIETRKNGKLINIYIKEQNFERLIHL